MKFSVLLPTRNRLEYLRYAVESVRRQDFSDWEIIVSDNCSTDDIAGYVTSLGDPRIKYFRTTSFVPVTDNWNNALDKSSGDYVVMLGDDDGLMPNYFSSLLRDMESFPDPDFAYTSAYFFAYPAVIPEEPAGFLRRDRNKVFDGGKPFWLDKARAWSVVRGYLDYRMPVASNMQFSLISRRKIRELSRGGQFFHSPFPDFYMTPALFLTSEKILIVPRPLVIIGISPKSYGFFHFNNQAGAGESFLKNTASLQSMREEKHLLPGTSYNDSWFLANEALSANISGREGFLPNNGRYRFLQIMHNYKKRFMDRDGRDLGDLKKRMTPFERTFAGPAFAVGFSGLRLVPGSLKDRVVSILRALIGQHAMRPDQTMPSHYANLLEVFESFRSAGGNA